METSTSQEAPLYTTDIERNDNAENTTSDLTKVFYDIDDTFGYRARAVLSYIFHNGSTSKDNSFTVSDVSNSIKLPPASLRLILIKMEMKELIKVKYKLGKSNVYCANEKGIETYLNAMAVFFRMAEKTSLRKRISAKL